MPVSGASSGNLRSPPASVSPPMLLAIAKPSTSTSHEDGEKNGREHVVAEAQLVDAGGEAQQRHLAVEVEADDLQAPGRGPLLVFDAEPDLLEVHRAERPLDRQEPRAVAAAGAQRDGQAVAVVLHGHPRAEAGPRRGSAAAGVVHDAGGHGVVAATAAERHREPAELDLHPAGELRQ